MPPASSRSVSTRVQGQCSMPNSELAHTCMYVNGSTCVVCCFAVGPSSSEDKSAGQKTVKQSVRSLSCQHRPQCSSELGGE